MDYFFGGRPGQHQSTQPAGPQPVPVNVYQTEEHVVITAPMPGVEADNIDIDVQGSRVSLRATLRGPKQEHRNYLVHEWTYGPYERVIELPMDVDASRANASHGNGVLVLTLPKAPHLRTVHVPLRQTSSQTASRQGHEGGSAEQTNG
jgi:HSP20 family molecular chaperone IbpA